jgi:hypothetical protein
MMAAGPMRSLMSPGKLVAALLLSPFAATGLTGQLTTDRPDFVESSAVVGAGIVQVETSVAVTRAEPGFDVWTTPTLVRVGLGPRWELRAESAFLTHSSVSRGQDETGISDLALGAKVHLQEARGMRPSSGVLVHTNLPTGSEFYRGRGVRPSVRLSAEWELCRSVFPLASCLERPWSTMGTASCWGSSGSWSVGGGRTIFGPSPSWRFPRSLLTLTAGRSPLSTRESHSCSAQSSAGPGHRTSGYGGRGRFSLALGFSVRAGTGLE